MNEAVCVFLAGDVMTGRGIDQILAHPSAPQLFEDYVRDARDYVRLAEENGGAITVPVPPAYLWGDALAEFDRRAPMVRIVNLETAVTTAAVPAPGKGIHYRMHPANVDCLVAARLDVCVLANNHVLDWGRNGLAETLTTLQRAGLSTAGAGLNREAAEAPAIVPLPRGARLLVFACATGDSGVLNNWAATRTRSGVALLEALDDSCAQRLAQQIAARRRPRDLVVVSIHWGDNWVAEVPAAHRRFAHALIDRGAADIVHGHSSHHPLPYEIHRDRLVLYGCGDLINDYEGIGMHGPYRADIGCLYFAWLDSGTGTLRRLDIVPLQRRRLQLVHADADARTSVESLLRGQGPPLAPAPSGTGWSLRIP